MGTFVFVDVEACGPCPSMGQCTQVGAVELDGFTTFEGILVPDRETELDPDNPAVIRRLKTPADKGREKQVWTDFAAWLGNLRPTPIFWSDNNGYDWQWVNDGLWRCAGRNPFGHSSRRIGDYYAGLVGDLRAASKWKKLRITKHDHVAVHDALGNAEAFKRIMAGER